MEDLKEIVSLEDALKFDPQAEIERICAFIRSEARRRGVHGVLLGLSGGLDSTTCAYLLARALPRDQIHVMLLPERDSSAGPRQNALKTVDTLNLSYSDKNLGELFELLGLYRIIPEKMAADRGMIEKVANLMRRLSGSAFLFNWTQRFAYGERRGLAARVLRSTYWDYAGKTQAFILGKVRARMLVLSTQAALFDSLLVCTTDRSEGSVGFYDPLGDGAGDIAPPAPPLQDPDPRAGAGAGRTGRDCDPALLGRPGGRTAQRGRPERNLRAVGPRAGRLEPWYGRGGDRPPGRSQPREGAGHSRIL